VDDVDALLGRVKKEAHGLMPAATYRRIYETAARAGGGTIVEIGTYRGAATLALALGARAAGAPYRIVTADLLRPGIGPAGAGIEQRIAELCATFACFGVEDKIRFVHGGSPELVAAADPERIDLLLLDGGGRLDIDLAALWERLAPRCPIVIDDIDGRTRVHLRWGEAIVDQKHRLSKLLTDRLVEAGLLVAESESLGTGWYRKGEADGGVGSIERLAIPAYRELTRVMPEIGQFSPVRALLRGAARRAPRLAAAWRRIRPGRSGD
jgi:predicted O-methyltransferase YrrM